LDLGSKKFEEFPSEGLCYWLSRREFRLMKCLLIAPLL
jgi:hypothetical protein